MNTISTTYLDLTGSPHSQLPPALRLPAIAESTESPAIVTDLDPSGRSMRVEVRWDRVFEASLILPECDDFALQILLHNGQYSVQKMTLIQGMALRIRWDSGERVIRLQEGARQ